MPPIRRRRGSLDDPGDRSQDSGREAVPLVPALTRHTTMSGRTRPGSPSLRWSVSRRASRLRQTARSPARYRRTGWAGTPAVDQRSTSLQAAQVLDRAAGKHEDGTDLKETAALELEVIRHRFRSPVGLHLRHRDIAEYRVPVDACLLIGVCEVIENHRAAENARNACRASSCPG